MHTYEKRINALQLYEQTKSVTKTIRVLEYPGRQTLYRWIKEQSASPKERSVFRDVDTPDHPRHPSAELKPETLHRCYELGEDIKSVSEEIGYSRASIYAWWRKYLQKGAVALMGHWGIDKIWGLRSRRF
ncbi:MAG: helix-turn-helix domain-containing protein, partial [Sphaerochaetaceae bacterium]|nr:helix-turn-helix domain-containing protein [Sphaerochaetaceae bacterium]